MSKKLNVEAITNELHGASLYFNPPLPAQQAERPDTGRFPLPSVAGIETPVMQTSEPVNTRTPEHAHARAGARPSGRTPERLNTRTPVQVNTRTPERGISRQSYNVYHDQHQALKRLEAQSTLKGGKPLNISEMVRQALDDYLALQPAADANTRTGERLNE